GKNVGFTHHFFPVPILPGKYGPHPFESNGISEVKHLASKMLTIFTTRRKFELPFIHGLEIHLSRFFLSVVVPDHCSANGYLVDLGGEDVALAVKRNTKV